MKRLAESLTLGLAVLCATAAAPKAADWAVGSGGAVRDFGSVKDYRNAAVPVPAPTPAPTNFGMGDWYIRADLGYNFSTDASLSATGGLPQPDQGNLSNFAFGGIGAGRYITPSIRADFTLDLEPKRAVTKSPITFAKSITQPNAATPGSTDTLNYAVTNADGTSTADQTALVNFYYDFHNSSRFTPYVGAGIGIDFKSLKRNYSQNAACVSASNDINGPYLPAGNCPVPLQQVTGFNNSTYANSIGFAAALMLGASYKVTDGISLDTGYRMLWDGASITANGSGIGGPTNITVSDRLNHEFRTGVRVDLN